LNPNLKKKTDLFVLKCRVINAERFFPLTSRLTTGNQLKLYENNTLDSTFYAEFKYEIKKPKNFYEKRI